jgi:hypothetical protein
MLQTLFAFLRCHFVALGLVASRHIFLSEALTAPGRVRFLSTPIELAEGAKQTWVTVTRTGTFTDPRYGRFDITPAMLAQMVANFDARVLGQEVFFDVAHQPNDGAAARVLRLAVEGTKLRALVEWTAFGTDAVRNRGFAYLSAEYHENWLDNERGNPHGCVLLGAGLTTRPVIKNLDRVALSQADADDDAKLAIHPNLLKHLEQPDMEKHLEALRKKLLSQGMTEAQAAPILAAAKTQLELVATDEAKCLALVTQFTAMGESLATQIKALAAAGGGAAAVTLSPTITMGGLDAAGVGAEVARVLAQRDQAAANDATALAGKHKLLSDTLTASKTLSAERQADVLVELAPLVTKDLSDEQVTKLAAFALAQESRGSAAAQLALMGYRPPSGSVHITVDSSNGIMALQQQVDRRMGLADATDTQRYARTGGQLLAGNKAFAEKCLAQFDAVHGARLVAEHKMLAGGVGVVADTAVPAIFERTVLRESLYNLTGLAFVNVGTADFAAVIGVPYSYRDNSAAGINSTRVYELQGVPRAGIIQTVEEARPMPQKLGMRISNEMRYLLGGSPIDFDPLAENVRNIVRVVSEDTDRVIQNEVLNSADEALTATITDTLTAQVNGTNRVFVTTQFPVVRPRSTFALTGVQVGATLNPLVVTYNAIVRSEYRQGVALPAGLYYTMDYNVGELRLLNEAGVLQTPAAAALTVAYTYTLNCAKSNLDVTAPAVVGDVWDNILTQVGGCKVVVENDRYYTADMVLMSGAVDNAMGQAKTFQANSSRPGSGLGPDGSVGMIKGIAAFNTRAPGLNTGDARIVVGERGNTRFRMLRPFQMKEMSEAKNAQGDFIGAQDGYGEQYVVCMTPMFRKNANRSLVLFSATGRVARVS